MAARSPRKNEAERLLQEADRKKRESDNLRRRARVLLDEEWER